MKKLEVEVINFEPNAMSDDFGLQGCESFDGTKLGVFGEEGEICQHIWIYHDQPVAHDSVWRSCGLRLSISMDEQLLKPGVLIFVGAVSEVERM